MADSRICQMDDNEYVRISEDGESGGDDDGLVGALCQMALGGEAKAGLRLPRLRALAGPGSPPVPDDQNGPALPEDVFDVRARAKAAQGDAPPRPGPRAAPSYEELREQVQVDLNDEANLDDLEDSHLVEHMRRARAARAADEVARAALPRKEGLRAEDTEGRRALSALTIQLKELQMALQCASDEVYAHAVNAGRLADGQQPHGYPAAGGPASGLEHLKKKLLAAVDDFGEITVALGEFEQKLALARRRYETVVDGLDQWCAYHEGGSGGA